MTLEELEQYRALYLEIDAIAEQRDAMYNTYHSPSFSSAGSFSAEPHSPVETALKKIQKLEDLYDKKIKDLRIKAETIEDWLYTVDNPFVRSCIRYHYMLGYSWKETSKKMYGYDSYYNARKIVFRYFGRE